MRFVPSITFALGLALGVVGALWLIPPVDPITVTSVQPAVSDQSGELQRLRGLLDTRDASLAESARELARLREELAEARAEAASAAADPRPASHGLETPEEATARRLEAMERGMLRFAERRTGELVDRYGLSEEQAASLRDHFAELAAHRLEATRARANGEEPAPWTGPDTPEVLAEILTPEQMAAYDEYEEAVRLSRAETAATARMNAIAPELGLSEAQKDAVYAIYYEDIEARLRESSNVIEPGEIDEALARRMQQILTSEQYTQWMQRENSRRRGPPGF